MHHTRAFIPLEYESQSLNTYYIKPNGAVSCLVWRRTLHEEGREVSRHRRILRCRGRVQDSLQQDSVEGKGQARRARTQTCLLLRPHKLELESNRRIQERHQVQERQHRHTPQPGTPADEGGELQGGGKGIPAGFGLAARQRTGTDGAGREGSRLTIHSEENGHIQLAPGGVFADAFRRRVRPTVLHLYPQRGTRRRA